MKIFNKIFNFFVILFAVLILASCDKTEQKEKYEVSFDTNGGTMYYTVRALEGTIINLPTPSKEGYSFNGWFDNEELNGDALSETYEVTKNVTLYVRWDAYEGTISFESNGGTEYDDVVFMAQKVYIPTPEKEGYIFQGWYPNEDLSGERFIEGVILPTGNLTLYAKWEEIIGQVTFVSNGGTEYDSVATAGQKVSIPTPNKEGYIFAGWYDNENFVGSIYNDSFIPTGNVTLYAKWAKTSNYITLEENGGTKISDIIHYDDEELSLPTPFRYGYKFVGWYDNAELEGEPISKYYKPVSDVILYAKWEKITYLYMYYGDNIDSLRLEFNEGDIITLEQLNDILIPEDLKVEDYLGFMHEVPFKYWAFEGYDEYSHTEVTSDITVGSEHIILVAQYDYSEVPANEHLTLDKETGVYTTTGKVAHVFINDAPQTPYVYSVDLSFTKGISGGVGPAFRMSVPDTDYHYESGCNYLSPNIIPSDGSMQISSVLNGSWSRLVSNIPFESMPLSWQEKYNNTAANYKINMTMTIVDYGDSFEVYIDNELAFSYAQSSTLAKYTGNDLGLRSSTTPTKISNITVSTGYKVSFNTNSAELTANDVLWLAGKIELPTLIRDGYALSGWYYDKDLTQLVDDEKFMIKEDTTLYAKWSDEYYIVSFDSNGGTVCQDRNWVTGKLVYPTSPTKVCQIFTGWYYDKECTLKVDPYEFDTTENITLYAGWRYPYHYLTLNDDGSYTYSKKTVAVLGLAESGIPKEGTYNEFSQTITMTKGAASVGIAFRMNVGVDYAYENVGTDYLSVQFADKVFRISYVENGSWKRLLPNNADYAFDKLPQQWQDKYNNTADGEQITVKLTIRDYGSYFEAYIDDVLAYTYGENGETVDLTKFTGNGYGVRSSASTSVIYADIVYKNVVCE